MSDIELKQAIQLIKSGDKAEAKSLLIRMVREDPYDEQAWLWLASVAQGEQRIYCLQKVVALNPQNEKARAALQKLKPQPAHHEKQLEQVPGRPMNRQPEPPHSEPGREPYGGSGNIEQPYLHPNGMLVFKPNAETVLTTQVIPKLVLGILTIIFIALTEGNLDVMVFIFAVVFVLIASGIDFLISTSRIYNIRLSDDQLNGPMLFGYAFLHQNIAINDIDLNKTHKFWGFLGVYSFVSVQRSSINLIGFDKETFHDLNEIIQKRQVH